MRALGASVLACIKRVFVAIKQECFWMDNESREIRRKRQGKRACFPQSKHCLCPRMRACTAGSAAKAHCTDAFTCMVGDLKDRRRR
jgi:hypothetical protein